jgi:hypothetical protein
LNLLTNTVKNNQITKREQLKAMWHSQKIKPQNKTTK